MATAATRATMHATGVTGRAARRGLPAVVDGPADRALAAAIGGIAAGSDGTLYLSDLHRIRIVRGGVVSTLAGQ